MNRHFSFVVKQLLTQLLHVITVEKIESSRKKKYLYVKIIREYRRILKEIMITFSERYRCDIRKFTRLTRIHL